MTLTLQRTNLSVNYATSSYQREIKVWQTGFGNRRPVLGLRRKSSKCLFYTLTTATHNNKIFHDWSEEIDKAQLYQLYKIVSSSDESVFSCRPELLKSSVTSSRLAGGQMRTVWDVLSDRKRGRICRAAVLISARLTLPRALTKSLRL